MKANETLVIGLSEEMWSIYYHSLWRGIMNDLQAVTAPVPEIKKKGFFCRILHHNPFYIIASVLILYGLNTAFGTSTDEAEARVLMSVMAFYALIMALSTVLIVRLGSVWEDARSMLMICLLMVMAISVSVDELSILKPDTGRSMLLSGMAIALLLSEGILRWLRIRLAPMFKYPLYSFICLFYIYPVIMTWLLEFGKKTIAAWGIYSFSVVGALLMLSLVPAVRKGTKYVAENGTPWKWPWFPWMAFGFIGFGLCVRSYYLSLSFYSGPGMESIFSLYFLAPLVLAAAVILLETGIIQRMFHYK